MNIHATTSASSTQSNASNDTIVNILPFKPTDTEQLRFNLTIPTADQELPRKRLHMKRKSFAIACQTNMTSRIHFDTRNHAKYFSF